ncbi:hypothetical protein F9C07_2286782 [Aspergillus flavus]|uniref:Zn(2)-C6 fungal-type domain-containing protein n=1 Tax=Aspergillus flavus (strain ATCC 200026 / FGSC A1120 / IAM 13836 / NRRL 3357 / JCM 12722 / SRRC 167) TaxID=332952 RepID=A0A7U2N394_ASPFN|nr:uncharacterized protein G4B84_009044 [Aspergillus flavus NRRL3357]KAF7622709.1 hypothetical protein AFLA_010031 [Aspergillus flavus NRRL3357]QMW33578.1 hypothetical protein G4B84_009044 [Aspergillus flavus NRRL3357]QRD94741.1 hypothetical protein F9C07_2286782 [Aspergillus flavus]
MVDLEQSSPSSTPGLLRKRRRAKVACESCRTRKRKCDGQEPCGTCVQLEYDCHYCPTLKAHKRTSETPRDGQPSTNAVEPPVAGHNPVPDISNTTEPPYLLNLENHARIYEHESQVTYPLFLQSQAEPSSCACLSLLYLMMEQLRAKDRIAVPGDLVLLRNCVSSSKQVLYCQECPRRYLSIVQNGTMLGVLCMCIAACYARALETIETEMKQASDTNERKQLCISASSPEALHDTAPLGNVLSSFSVDIAASEWANIMRRTVKVEIFGTESNKENCFMSFIDTLQERQRGWHQVPPAPDCPSTYQTLCDMTGPEPVCLVIVNEAKKLVNSFKF